MKYKRKIKDKEKSFNSFGVWATKEKIVREKEIYLHSFTYVLESKYNTVGAETNTYTPPHQA